MTSVRAVLFTDEGLERLARGEFRFEEIGDDLVIMAHVRNEDAIVEAIESEFPDVDVEEA